MGGYPTKNDNYPYFSYICSANNFVPICHCESRQARGNLPQTSKRGDSHSRYAPSE